MEKIILKSKNEEELRQKVSKTLVLAPDETIVIKELKKPFKFLFFSREGEYEVTIVKKSEVKKNDKVKKVNKNDKIKKVENKKSEHKKFETKKVENKVVENDSKIALLRSVIKEFLAISNLRVVIEKIEVKNNIYNVELNGEDVRYIIGEKGSALASLEYLLSFIEELRDIKVYIDSNNYKDKREGVLRELANKTAKTVLRTKKKVKLNPMPSRERKIIHEEISKIDGLETISIGAEPKRYLVIKLKK